VANKNQRITRLRQPTKSRLGKTKQANDVVSKPEWQSLLHRVEHDIEQAFAVMDRDSGKMMNYRQLRKHPKYNKTWSTSSANEFRRLANKVGGRVKGTKTI
jgi:Ca2+-binding EF-hand superfamily protein